MRKKRSEACRIEIPNCVDPERRERCLADPELFLRTYMSRQFYRPIEKVHRRIINAIVDIAEHGGRKAIAAPRGIGKSETTKGMTIYCICKRLVNFPVPVAAANKLAGRIYRDLQREFATNDLLYEDFPEICHPIRELDGSSVRAIRQHIDGQLTNLVWKTDDFSRLPDVPGSEYGGVKFTFAGLDTALRGLNIESDRPDLILIDDPETRESARSPLQIESRMDMIDKDLAGLGTGDRPIAMIMLTTLQNTYCASYQYTDLEQKPAWDGVRYGMIEKWPTYKELWEDYCVRRKMAQKEGDPYAWAAVQFYLNNRTKMDEGAELLVEHFEPQFHRDGRQLTYSSLQVQYNKIADTSMEAYCTEYQNDPPPEIEADKVPLTPAIVMSTTTGLARWEIPESHVMTSVGIDIGKRLHHWIKVAWDDDATGSIMDYDVATTHGLTKVSSKKAIEVAVRETLEQLGEELLSQDYAPEIVLVDSGYARDAVYEACERLGGIFRPVKGVANRQFRLPKQSPDKVPFWEAYASKELDHAGRLRWLYLVNSEYWKNWAQEHFLVEPHDENGVRGLGSLALFEPPHGDAKFHRTFARHMCSEGLEMIPQKEGKPDKPTWVVRDPRHNHWLDALGYACAGAACWGVRGINPLAEPEPPAKQEIDEEEETSAVESQPFLVTQRG